jgi:hypothetical protein
MTAHTIASGLLLLALLAAFTAVGVRAKSGERRAEGTADD